jgi:hypothetical protein
VTALTATSASNPQHHPPTVTQPPGLSGKPPSTSLGPAAAQDSHPPPNAPAAFCGPLKGFVAEGTAGYPLSDLRTIEPGAPTGRGWAQPRPPPCPAISRHRGRHSTAHWTFVGHGNPDQKDLNDSNGLDGCPGLRFRLAQAAQTAPAAHREWANYSALSQRKALSRIFQISIAYTVPSAMTDGLRQRLPNLEFHRGSGSGSLWQGWQPLNELCMYVGKP